MVKKAIRPAIFTWRQTEPELILCAVRSAVQNGDKSRSKILNRVERRVLRGRRSTTSWNSADAIVIVRPSAIDGPPEILPSALNLHEQLVQIPGVTHAPSSAPQPSSVVGPKRVTPVPNRLVGHDDASLG